MGLKRTWQLSDLPHDKLASRGVFSLSTVELIALLLRCQKPRQSDVELARKLLFSTGNRITHIVKYSYKQLVHELDLSESSAMSIVAALELGRRLQNEKHLSNYTRIKTPDQVQALMRPYLQGLPHEECWILLLNDKGYLLSKHRIFVGGTKAVEADPKVVLRHIVQEPTCSRFMIVHNHPNNDTQPTKADQKFTARLMLLAQALICEFADHIIYTDSAILSFEKTGMLKHINSAIDDTYLS